MNENKNFFRTSAEDFKKIPGAPVAYWLTDGMFAAMGGDSIGRIVDGRMGLTTGNNDAYLRLWFEIGFHKIGFGYDRQSAKESGLKWFPYNKAGEFRRWYGNLYYVVDWKTDGRVMQTTMHPDGKRIWAHNFNLEYNFLPHFSWSDITSGMLSFRWYPKGCLFDASANAAFSSYSYMYLLGLTNASFVKELSVVLNPTIHFKLGDFYKIPFVEVQKELVERNVSKLIDYARKDWDSYETSWDFKVNPLVAERMREVVGGKVDSGKREVDSGQWIVDSAGGATNHSPLTTSHSPNHSPLSTLYTALRRRWAAACEEMRRLEIENNRIFIEAYGLQDELTPDVPWNEITLTCNPWYRYGVRGEGLGIGDEGFGIRDDGLPQTGELEERLRADTVKELVSYAVGCMMGRYSLEKPGLILADQASTIADYWEKLGKLGIRDEELGMRNEELGIGGGCEFERRKGEPHSSSLIPNSSSALIPNPSSHIPHSFSPDDDGIIPVLDNDWFADDIVTQFKAFVKAAFGEKHFFENMAWIEEALGKDVCSYFTKDFYKDHLQRYQNRPIYWLFQSPKGAFRALIYMHRYRPDTVGGVLGYLRSLQTKIDNQLDVAMRIGADESKSASERVQANKDIAKYARAKKELDEYEKNVLYPLSTERIEIDLDDGVKVNYRKFGAALAKVKALEGKGE